MSARDDYPLALGVAMSRHLGRAAWEVGKALDEIDRLRALQRGDVVPAADLDGRHGPEPEIGRVFRKLERFAQVALRAGWFFGRVEFHPTTVPTARGSQT